MTSKSPQKKSLLLVYTRGDETNFLGQYYVWPVSWMNKGKEGEDYMSTTTTTAVQTFRVNCF